MAQKKTRLVLARRTALLLGWILSLAVAAGLGWMSGRLSVPGGERGWELGAFRSEGPAPWSSSGTIEAAVEPPTRARRLVLPAEAGFPPEEPAVEERIRTPSLPEMTPAPVVVETPAPALPEPLVTVELPEVVPREPVADSIERAGRLADSGDAAGARSEAEALLVEFRDYSGLTAALEADGAGEVRARLDALRVLHLGGLESVTTEMAREMKRSYASTPEVQDAIRDWRLLKPRIRELESSIEDGERVIVSGALENPDIGTVRRVLVEVEALDAAGNVLATEQIRVRPRAIGAGEAGSFTVRFDSIDPSFVVRTRATVVKWQSEVLGS